MKPVALITGASGFIGSWLAEELIECGYSIIGIDLRVPAKPGIWMDFATSSLESVDFGRLLENVNLHCVFHLAGGASVASSVTDPFADFASLLPGTARLAWYVIKFQRAAKFVLFSSAAVYGNPAHMPITELTELKPMSPYGAHKAICEALLSYYANFSGLNCIILRLFSVYGPGLRKQLLWDISEKVRLAQKNNEKQIQLWGTGEEQRDFIYITDVCKAVSTIVRNDNSPGITYYNVSSGQSLTVSDIANMLVNELSQDITVDFNQANRVGDPKVWKADITKLMNAGFRITTQPLTGVQNVARWFKALTKD